MKFTLLTWGVGAFVAHDDIEPTREWQDVIESALATCDALVAWLTPDFHEASGRIRRSGFCVGRSILILPIRLGLDPYGFVGKYQAIPGSGRPFEIIAADIADVLISHDLTTIRMADALVQRFADSGSFNDARRSFETLKKIPARAWSTELLERVENAVATNSEIADAWYGAGMLPDAARRFVAEQRITIA